MAIHSSIGSILQKFLLIQILAWRIPWMEEPGGIQPIVLQRLKHNGSKFARMHTHTHIRAYL